MREYFRGDERPFWTVTVSVDGVFDNMTTGYTFQVKIHTLGDPTDVKLTKTTAIAGATNGRVVVTWVPNDLDIAPGVYTRQLKASRTSDGAEWTINEPFRIKARA